jgi:hypothetical protein
MTIKTSTDCPKSESSFSNQTTSHAIIVVPLYSAFMFDNAIVGCFLLTINNTTSKRKHETTG